jgi:hypothetical protein
MTKLEAFREAARVLRMAQPQKKPPVTNAPRSG